MRSSKKQNIVAIIALKATAAGVLALVAARTIILIILINKGGGQWIFQVPTVAYHHHVSCFVHHFRVTLRLMTMMNMSQHKPAFSQTVCVL